MPEPQLSQRRAFNAVGMSNLLKRWLNLGGSTWKICTVGTTPLVRRLLGRCSNEELGASKDCELLLSCDLTPYRGVPMVFDCVVGPSWEELGDLSPMVPVLLVSLEKNPFLA